MSANSFNKIALLLLSFSFVSHVAYKYFTQRKKKETRREINEVLMFSYGAKDMKRSKYSRCMISRSMDRLLYYLNSPKHSIDICMYVLTNLDLTNAVLKLHYKGIKIRVIADADMTFSSGSCVRKLEKQGIPVRWMKSTNLMHHKFSIIDANGDHTATPFVIAGSLNWTNQALSGNWEDVIVTSQRDLVEQYKTEFDRLWTLFKPIVV